MSIMAQEIWEQPRVLTDVLDKNKAVIREIVSLLRKHPPQAVCIVARGTSDHVGVFTKYLGEYFLGIPFTLMASSLINVYRRPFDFSGKVVLAISQSGQGPDVLGVVREAKRQGALTISVTNEENSPLARDSGAVLRCYAGLERSVAATKTCTASMMAIAGLIGQWANADSFIDNLLRVPDGLLRLFDRSHRIEMGLTPFSRSEHCLVVARGFNYASALETALKLQETSGIDARGYSAADLQHGPIAMAHEKCPALVYAVNGPALSSVLETVSLLKTSNVPVWMIGNAGGVERFDLPEIPSEEVSPFFTTVFGQIFAERLSSAKKRNPDAPPGLTKVTRTL